MITSTLRSRALRALGVATLVALPLAISTGGSNPAAATTSDPPYTTFKALSYNVKHPSDGDPGGGYKWANRKSFVVKIIRDALPGIVGLQEVHTDLPDAPPNDMRTYLNTQLGDPGTSSGYAYSAVPLDAAKMPDGTAFPGTVRERENPIYYRTGKFTLDASGVVCYTETAGECSSEHDHLSLTWAQLSQTVPGQSDQHYFVVNTHLQDGSTGAADRVSEAKQIHKAIVKYNKRTNSNGNVVTDPIILMGDMNSQSGGSGPATAVDILAEGANSVHTYNLDAPVGISVINGEETFNAGWGAGTPGDADHARLDYIFADQKILWTSHDVLTKTYNISGVTISPSDHYPITALGCTPAANCPTGTIGSGP